MVKLTINNKPVTVPEGISILQAATQSGITIPTLCYHKDLSPFGGCRLCVVELKGSRLPVDSCTQIVTEGMNVKTETPLLRKHRRFLLKLLLSTYYDHDHLDKTDGQNELLKWAKVYRINVKKYSAKLPRYPIDSDSNPFIRVNLNKCIVCGRCVRACNEVQVRFVWSMADRGYDTHLVAGLEQTMLDARCESCGACVAYCPTGALENKLSMYAGVPEKIVTTTCTYCGVGCQLDLNNKQNRIIRVTSNPEAVVNGMHLCVKGRYGYDFINHPDRLTQPLVRQYLLDESQNRTPSNRGNWIAVDWGTALDLVARKLNQFRQQWGPDSIGFLSSAKCTNEENFLMNKLARQVIGTNNIDHCARLCHSSSTAGLTMVFGSGAMTNSMRDIAENSATLFIVGSNTTEQHPVFGCMLRQAVLRRNVKLIVADPRKIDLTEFATLHLRLKPGTDIALLNGLMHIILNNDWEDKDFITNRCEGYKEFKENLHSYPPEVVSSVTGIPISQLYEAADIMAHNKPMAAIWAMGITQHIIGVQNVISLANLQMLLGNIGIPGGGVNPLRGQNNVQGAGDAGALPNYFPGYQQVTSDEARYKFQNAWGTSLSASPGLTSTEMIPAIENGRIKALFILAENPVLSDPDTNHTRHCLEKLDFLVLQEIFPTETSHYADVLLPGVSFAEKQGTVTNTERRIQMVNQAIEPLGDSKPDWRIISELANLILQKGNDHISPSQYSTWEYHHPAEIMAEMAALTPIYAGVNYQRLHRGENLQWPVRDVNHNGTSLLHVGQFTRGKGHFIPTTHIPPTELPDAEYPFVMNTGRVLYHWHGGEMTRRAKGLKEAYSQSLLEISPIDAMQLGVENGFHVQVISRRGCMRAVAWITDRVPVGMIYANFHFPESPANALTIAALDPISKIPEFKVCAVRLEKIHKD